MKQQRQHKQKKKKKDILEMYFADILIVKF